MKRYVIVGNGAAAAACIEGIRSRDAEGEITVVSEEEREVYCRPLISYYLQGANDTLIRNYIEVEACFTSPEPSVDSIDENGDVVFAEEWRDSISIEETGRIRELAAEAVREFFCRFYAPGMEIDSSLIGELYSLRDGKPVISGAYNDLIKKKIREKVWR